MYQLALAAAQALCRGQNSVDGGGTGIERCPRPTGAPLSIGPVTCVTCPAAGALLVRLTY